MSERRGINSRPRRDQRECRSLAVALIYVPSGHWRDVFATDVSKVASILPRNPDAARLYSEGPTKLRELDPSDARALLLKATGVESKDSKSSFNSVIDIRIH